MLYSLLTSTPALAQTPALILAEVLAPILAPAGRASTSLTLAPTRAATSTPADPHSFCRLALSHDQALAAPTGLEHVDLLPKVVAGALASLEARQTRTITSAATSSPRMLLTTHHLFLLLVIMVLRPMQLLVATDGFEKRMHTDLCLCRLWQTLKILIV